MKVLIKETQETVEVEPNFDYNGNIKSYSRTNKQTTFKAEELEIISTTNIKTIDCEHIKTIDWEQRRFELVKEMLNSEYFISAYKGTSFDAPASIQYITEIADRIIKELITDTNFLPYTTYTCLALPDQSRGNNFIEYDYVCNNYMEKGAQK